MDSDKVIVTRKEAKLKGLSRYFTGKACILGGIGPRLVSSGECVCEFHKAKSAKRVKDRCNSDPEHKQKRLDIVKQFRKDKKEQYAILTKRYRDKEGHQTRNNRSRIWYNQKPDSERFEYSRSKYYKDLRSSMFNSAKQRAKRLNVPFDLTIDDIVVPDVCPVFGQKLEWGIKLGKTDNSPSLDRVIPEKGYVKGNVVVISWLANRIKSNATLDQLQQICDYITNQAASSTPIKAESGSENEAN